MGNDTGLMAYCGPGRSRSLTNCRPCSSTIKSKKFPFSATQAITNEGGVAAEHRPQDVGVIAGSEYTTSMPPSALRSIFQSANAASSTSQNRPDLERQHRHFR